MPSEPELIQLARTVDPLAARDYVKAKKWEPVSGVKGRLYLFRHPTERLRQVAIPKDRETDDYGEMMVIVAERIAELEHRSLGAVLNDLVMPNADLLRFRIAAPQTASGTLSLSQGIDLLEGAERALLASARNVLEPRSHYARLGRGGPAGAFVDSCRLGQTGRGSYIVNVVCPFDSADELAERDRLEKQVPLSRRVTTRLMQASGGLVSAIENEFDLPTDGHGGISSNFCEAIMAMRPDGQEASLDISATWAITCPLDTDVPANVVFQSTYFSRIERFCERLRPSHEPQKARYIGTVESLSGEIGDDGRRSGDVTLHLLLEGEAETLVVRARLGADDYELADKAHMRENGYVKCLGILHRRPRISSLEDVSDFELIE